MATARPAAVRRRIARRLERATGDLGSAAVARMERDKDWFRDLSAQDRAWIGLVVQAGITSFIHWFDEPDENAPISSEIFGAAPRALAGVVSLQQTVELVRLTISVVEENAAATVGDTDAPAVRDAILHYGREVAFATAEVYARTAELRGAWDARLEALLVDSVMRSEDEEAIRSRAGALGWSATGPVCAVVGEFRDDPSNDSSADTSIDVLRRAAQHAGFQVLCAVQGERLVVLLGDVDDPHLAGEALASHFTGDHVVIGPDVSDIAFAHRSSAAAIAGLKAVSGWTGAPRVVLSDELLPERILSGDRDAAQQLIDEIYLPLLRAGAHTLETVDAYLANGRALEATSRALFVHANTVRYRLRAVEALTGLSPGDARHGYTLRLALTLGRLFAPHQSEL
jgi:sugar diacid utilization regulator